MAAGVLVLVPMVQPYLGARPPPPTSREPGRLCRTERSRRSCSRRRPRRGAIRAHRGRQCGLLRRRDRSRGTTATSGQPTISTRSRPGVRGEARRNSPPFRDRLDLHAAAANAPFYFLAQRDGPTGPTVLEREPSHLNDAHAKVYETPEYNGFLVHDLVAGERSTMEGGWFDAATTSSSRIRRRSSSRSWGRCRITRSCLGDGPDFAARRGSVSTTVAPVGWVAQGPYYQVSMGNTGLGYLSITTCVRPR